jgi:BMFP domain-containing protein YqiC
LICPYAESELEGMSMSSAPTKKFTPEIDAQLYDEFVAVAERNGQTKRHVLEQALRFYLQNVVPSQHMVRREVMDAFEQTVARNRDLLERLAK